MKKIVVSLVCVFALFADETPLLPQKQEILQLKRKQVQEDAQVASKSWISPLMLSLSVSENKNATNEKNQLQNASLAWNQDIFRSGGITYTIEQAKANEAANLLAIDIQEAGYLKSLYTLKTQYERDTLLQKQSELKVKNMDIDLLMTKAKYKAGLSDLSQLNQSTLNRDAAKATLIGVNNALQSELYELKKIAKDTSNLLVPDFSLPSKKEYLSKNMEILQFTKQEKAAQFALKNRTSSYFPKLAFNASYGYVKNSYSSAYLFDYEGNNYNYGLTLSMPLIDVSAFNSVESAKLQAIQTKTAQNDRAIELESEYDKRINNIKNYEEKIVLADEMIKMYAELYDFTKHQVKAGFKSQYDLDSLKNSLEIQKLEKEIQKHNSIIEKIALYFDVKNEGK